MGFTAREKFMFKQYKYDVALSFATEDRKIVEEIANELRNNRLKVFYDDFLKDKLLGKDLYEYFKDSYGKNTKFVIIFISKHYPLKDWTNFEFEIARGEAKQRKEEFILPIRLDDTPLFGLKPTIGYIKYHSTNLMEIIDIIVRKVYELDRDFYQKHLEVQDFSIISGTVTSYSFCIIKFSPTSNLRVTFDSKYSSTNCIDMGIKVILDGINDFINGNLRLTNYTCDPTLLSREMNLYSLKEVKITLNDSFSAMALGPDVIGASIRAMIYCLNEFFTLKFKDQNLLINFLKNGLKFSRGKQKASMDLKPVQKYFKQNIEELKIGPYIKINELIINTSIFHAIATVSLEISQKGEKLTITSIIKDIGAIHAVIGAILKPFKGKVELNKFNLGKISVIDTSEIQAKVSLELRDSDKKTYQTNAIHEDVIMATVIAILKGLNNIYSSNMTSNLI